MNQITPNLPRLNLVFNEDKKESNTNTEQAKTPEIRISTSLTIAQTLAAASKCAPTIIYPVDKTEISSFRQACYKTLAKNFFGPALIIIDKPNSHNNPEATIRQLQTRAINCLYKILKADDCKLYIDSQTIIELANALRLCDWTNREGFIETIETVRKCLYAEI